MFIVSASPAVNLSPPMFTTRIKTSSPRSSTQIEVCLNPMSTSATDSFLKISGCASSKAFTGADKSRDHVVADQPGFLHGLLKIVHQLLLRGRHQDF